MSSSARTQTVHRARAVAQAPVQALLARTDELARRWAIALILALPLERIAEIPLESFARQAPGFLAQVLRALQSDTEVERLAQPGGAGTGEAEGAPRLGELTGASGAPAAVEAIEALRGILWEALLDELQWPSFESSPARHVADLADRLAYVCSTALGSTLARSPAAETPAREGTAAAPLTQAPAPADERRRPVRSTLAGGVAIVDEAEPQPQRARRAPAPAPASASPAPRRRQETAGALGARARVQGRARPWDLPLDGEDGARVGTAGEGD